MARIARIVITHHQLPLADCSQGWFTLPDAPGLGIELNEPMLEKTISQTSAFH